MTQDLQDLFDELDHATENLALGYVMTHDGESIKGIEELSNSIGPSFDKDIQSLEEQGLIRLEEDTIRITDKGKARLKDSLDEYEDEDSEPVRKHFLDFAEGEEAYELKLSFAFEKTEVWRTIKVPKRIDFHVLHLFIQTMFGWRDYHLFDFTYTDVDGTTFMLNLPDEAQGGFTNAAEKMFAGLHGKTGDAKDARGYTLGELFPRMKKLTYTYDYGDFWNINIEVLGQTTLEDGHMVCTDGFGDAPCEDVGSEGGYLHFLEVIADKDHPDHDYLVEWGKNQGYEPFDLDSINERLTRWAKYDTIVGEEDEDFYVGDDEVDLDEAEEKLRGWCILFRDSLAAKNVSQRSRETHTENILTFLVDYVYLLRGADVDSSTVLAVDYLGEYLLDPANGLPTPEEYKSIISSIKMFFQAMLRNKVIDKASHKELLKQIRENQPAWMKTLKENQGA